MNRLKATNSVPFASRDTAPVSGTPQYATDGNPATSTPPTIWPAYAWNMSADEIIAVINDAGIALDDTNWGQLLQALRQNFGAAGTGVQVYNSGSGSFTVPANVSVLNVEMWGPGSGSYASVSGAPSGGGGAGGYLRKRLAVTPGAAIAYNVGPGGAAGTTGVAPVNPASDTTFGSLTASKGTINSLATLSVPGLGGLGGAGSGGDDNRQGSAAQNGGNTANAGGSGGASPGGGAPNNGGGVATAGYAPGGGASGAGTGVGGTTAQAGAAGAAGRIIIRW